MNALTHPELSFVATTVFFARPMIALPRPMIALVRLMIHELAPMLSIVGLMISIEDLMIPVPRLKELESTCVGFSSIPGVNRIIGPRSCLLARRFSQLGRGKDFPLKAKMDHQGMIRLVRVLVRESSPAQILAPDRLHAGSARETKRPRA